MPQVTTGDPLDVKPVAEMANDGFNALAVVTEQPIKLGVVGVHRFSLWGEQRKSLVCQLGG